MFRERYIRMFIEYGVLCNAVAVASFAATGMATYIRTLSGMI
jgi:hypothetical protein